MNINRRKFVKISSLAPLVYVMPFSIDMFGKEEKNIDEQDDLSKGFLDPPDEYRPCIFWDWVNDMVTKKGITSDLEQFKRIGLGGTLIMLVGTETAHGQMWADNNMPNPVISQTPEFFDMWKFAAEESARLGLTIRSQCGPGWCHSGGPWIKPDQAVQHIAYSELQVTGNNKQRTFLVDEKATGTAKAFHSAITDTDVPKWTEVILKEPAEIEAVALHPFDNNGIKGFGFPLRFTVEVASRPDFSDKQTIVSQTTDFSNPGNNVVIFKHKSIRARYVRLTATKNYTVFRSNKTRYLLSLAELEVISNGRNIAKGAAVKTSGSIEDFGYTEKALTDGFAMTTFYPGPGAERFTLLRPGYDYFTSDIAIVAFRDKKEISLDDVIDLTKLNKNGKIEWTVPEGNWLVRRYAMRNALAYNRHPPVGGKGLECDKLDKAAVDAMFDGMLGKYIGDSPHLVGKTIRAFEADSWEVGDPEWSAKFKEEFIRRRGYDPTPWLITFKSDNIIGTKDLTERFKNDLYLTQTDLFADNFFSHLADKASSLGMEFMTEPYIAPFDPVRMAGRVQVPMCEFWASSEMMFTARWAGSAANTYGRTAVASEAFTGRWNDGNWTIDPYAIKRVGDLAFCNGVNKMFFHGTALQPWGMDMKPGMPMFFWGTMFAPAQTWWEPGKEWVNYISRCQYMLTRGKNTADVAGLMPTLHWRGSMPEGLHKKYNYDLITEETLLKDMQYDKGFFHLPSGAKYRVLFLPKTKGKMTPEIISKLIQLVGSGGTVVCQDRPHESPGLTGYPQVDATVRQLAGQLWGKTDGKTVFENKVGSGRLIWMNDIWEDKMDPERRYFLETRAKGHAFWDNPSSTTHWSPAFIRLLNPIEKPDVEVLDAVGEAMAWGGRPETSAGIRKGEEAVAWIHRREGDTDIYFVSSQVATASQAQLVFRVNDKVPQVWCPETGKIYQCQQWSREDGRVKMSIPFAPFGSVFIVFKPKDKVTGGLQLSAPGKSAHTIALNNQWKVSFPKGLGAPETAILNTGSWTDNNQFGIKYFSGTATYEKYVTLTEEQLKSRVALDLGEIKNLAEIIINDIPASILWHPPFRAEIGHFLKPGKNKFTLKITNTWWNRMVGDLQLPEDLEWWPKVRYAGNDYQGYELKEFPGWVWTGARRPSAERVTFSPWRYAEKDSPLQRAGLIGPVELVLYNQ